MSRQALSTPCRIRATHVDGFRFGEWAIAQYMVMVRVDGKERLCRYVEFPDGVTDLWVVEDPWDPYEFAPLEEGDSSAQA